MKGASVFNDMFPINLSNVLTVYHCLYICLQREVRVRWLLPTDAATRIVLRSDLRQSSAPVYQGKWPGRHATNPPVWMVRKFYVHLQYYWRLFKREKVLVHLILVVPSPVSTRNYVQITFSIQWQHSVAYVERRKVMVLSSGQLMSRRPEFASCHRPAISFNVFINSNHEFFQHILPAIITILPSL